MNILFLAYETEGCGLSTLAQRFQEHGHEVLLVHGDTHNFLNNESIRNFYRDTNFDSWINYEEEYKKLYRSDWEVDWSFLDEFEKEYCIRKNFQQLLLTAPDLRRSHHFREPYYTPLESDDIVYYWAELQIRWLLEAFETFAPDLVVTFKRNYFIKNLAAEISLATGVPMLTLIRSRIKNYYHFTRHFGYGPDPDARSYLDDSEQYDLQEARDYAQQFRSANQFASLYDASSVEKIQTESLFTTREVLRDLRSGIWGIVKRNGLMRLKNKMGGKIIARNHFDSYSPAMARFQLRIARNRLRYIYRNPLSNTTPDRPFVYFPLHTLPESATLTLTTEYYEEDLIRYLSKELPAGYEIAVKENPNMIGQRPFNVYESLESHPNISMIDPKVPSKSLVEKSEGVCGISGTALLEAAIIGKTTLAFGRPEFLDVVDHVGQSEVPEFVKAVQQGHGSDPRRAEKYLQYLFDTGRELPLNKLRNKQYSEEFQEGVDIVFDMLQPFVADPPKPCTPEEVYSH